jgi:transcriptional regulator with GAF, ATPase, and Fis domain
MRGQMQGRFPMDVEVIGNSPSMKNINELIKVVADTGLSGIIYGETGVGKEVIARELHQLSNRRNRRFVKDNCAVLKRAEGGRSELEITEEFTIRPEMMDPFLHYYWSGNVRELANTIQRLMVHSLSA